LRSGQGLASWLAALRYCIFCLAYGAYFTDPMAFGPEVALYFHQVCPTFVGSHDWNGYLFQFTVKSVTDNNGHFSVLIPD
jgi:hypothetical protein